MLRYLVLLLMLASPTPSMSQLMTFFGEDRGTGNNVPPLESWPDAAAAYNSFSALHQAVAVVDFEGLSAGAVEPIALDFAGQEALITGRGEVNAISTGSYAGTFPTSGINYWLVDNPTASFMIAFASAQTSFGFFATDISDFYGTIMLLLDDGREIHVPAYEGWPSGSVLFFGICDPSAPFLSVTIVPDTIDHGWGPSVDGFGIDDLVIGVTTPIATEPQSWGDMKALYR